VAAGFIHFEITWRGDVFAGAPQSSSAASFGTLGINFWAHKPHSEQERATALAMRQAEACAVGPGSARETD
jgi:hypothetical protein